MRGIYTPVTHIRRQVFAEIARLAYDGGDYSRLNEIPYTIIPGEVPTYRDSVFKERAIVGERLRMAIGMPLRRADEFSVVSKGVREFAVDHEVFDPPIIDVIPFACMACDERSFYVTDNCRRCLAHPCTTVCPVKAVSLIDGKSHIDQEKCIRCGRCKEACPYNAIVKYERPCAAACGVNAIESDHLNRAKINHEKCVTCGMCLVSCPFGAIADKSEIFQLIKCIKSGEEVCAIVAPSFVGQFGPLATPDKLMEAMHTLGFSDVVEVALGADIGAMEEARHYIEKVAPGEQPFIGTSCCPSWAVMAKQNFPELAEYISESNTPMVETAKIIKQRNPNSKVVFIGPCISKKLEATRKSVKSHVDFVITFEELMGMMVAKDIEFADIDELQPLEDASSDGRGYAACGGVASAIVNCVKKLDPSQEVKVDCADGLTNCRKMLALAKAGKRDGYLLEGMACPGGCVGGPGTLMPPVKATKEVKQFADASKYKCALENPKATGEKE